jgi:hypothetical protein
LRIQDKIYQLVHRGAVMAKVVDAIPSMSRFAFSDVERESLRQRLSGPIYEAFFASGTRKVHKWIHYLDVYERYLGRYRNTDFRILEIGVFDGGSLEMWRRYFGAAATIVGVDINPQCAQRVHSPNIVRIGSQADRSFLEKVVADLGPFDVILDDGSHIAEHQRASLDILFPTLREGGIYIIEDTHTSYWPDWSGGYRRRTSIIEVVKRMVDDLHGWYHNHSTQSTARDWIDSIHFHDSMIILEKARKSQPGFLYAGISE